MKAPSAVLLAIFLGCPAVPLRAAGNGVLTLDGFLAEVRERNPEIIAARGLSRVYAGKAAQSGILSNPQLEFERMYVKDGDNFISGAPERSWTLKQGIRNPYKLYLERGAAKQEKEYYNGLYSDSANEVLSGARTAFCNYLLQTEYEKIYEETIELLKQFSSVAQTRYSVGRGPQSDAIKAQVELSKTLNYLTTVRQEKETAAALINSYRDKAPDEPLPATEGFPAELPARDFEALKSRALAANPYLRAMGSRVKASEKELTLSKAGYAPDFMLAYRRRSADSAAMDGTYDVSIGLDLPIWFSKQKAAVEEASAGREMAEARYNAARNRLLFELQEVSTRMQTYRRLIDLYRGTVIPQAEEALRTARSGYEADKTDFMDLIDADRSLLGVKKEYFEFLYDYQDWAGKLERLTDERIPGVKP